MSALGQEPPFLPGRPNVRFAPKADISLPKAMHDLMNQWFGYVAANFVALLILNFNGRRDCSCPSAEGRVDRVLGARARLFLDGHHGA